MKTIPCLKQKTKHNRSNLKHYDTPKTSKYLYFEIQRSNFKKKIQSISMHNGIGLRNRISKHTKTKQNIEIYLF
ncbi:hypothetical protein HanRHA438_Chr08g0344721 [Helianthus annuus]|nr:hypothetical protein HanRHA438_Chr08g0344721 [Helianthus annuus]